jgi:hypothetical protein
MTIIAPFVNFSSLVPGNPAQALNLNSLLLLAKPIYICLTILSPEQGITLVFKKYCLKYSCCLYNSMFNQKPLL